MKSKMCVVPMCRNGTDGCEGRDYICTVHWIGIPKNAKRHHRKIVRLLVKRGDVTRNGQNLDIKTEIAWRIMQRSWARLIKLAIENGVGI